MCNCRVEGRNFFSLAYCGACAKLLYVPIHCSDNSVTFYIDTYVHVLHACFCKRERVKIRVCYLIIKSFVLIACLHFYVCNVFFMFVPRAARPCAFFYCCFCMCSWLQQFVNKFGASLKCFVPIWVSFCPTVIIITI